MPEQQTDAGAEQKSAPTRKEAMKAHLLARLDTLRAEARTLAGNVLTVKVYAPSTLEAEPAGPWTEKELQGWAGAVKQNIPDFAGEVVLVQETPEELIERMLSDEDPPAQEALPAALTETAPVKLADTDPAAVPVKAPPEPKKKEPVRKYRGTNEMAALIREMNKGPDKPK